MIFWKSAECKSDLKKIVNDRTTCVDVKSELSTLKSKKKKINNSIKKLTRNNQELVILKEMVKEWFNAVKVKGYVGHLVKVEVEKKIKIKMQKKKKMKIEIEIKINNSVRENEIKIKKEFFFFGEKKKKVLDSEEEKEEVVEVCERERKVWRFCVTFNIFKFKRR